MAGRIYTVPHQNRTISAACTPAHIPAPPLNGHTSPHVAAAGRLAATAAAL